MSELLSAPPAIVAAGVEVFSTALRAQGAAGPQRDHRPRGRHLAVREPGV